MAAGCCNCRFSIGDRPLLCSTTRRPDFTYENRALELSIFAALSGFAGLRIAEISRPIGEILECAPALRTVRVECGCCRKLLMRSGESLFDLTACPRESPISVPKARSAFHRHAQQNVFRRRDVRQQSRSFVRRDPGLMWKYRATDSVVQLRDDDWNVNDFS
jgi:hypothetical protein